MTSQQEQDDKNSVTHDMPRSMEDPGLIKKIIEVKEPNAPQQLALLQLQQQRERGLNKSLVVLPSGAGKTYLAAFDTKQAGAKSVLFLVHRREILEQAADTFKQVHNLRNSQIGFVMNEQKEFGRPFTFATIQTVSRPKNLEILSKYHFDYVVVGEYHHVSALSYQNILDNLNTSFLLGLTATPFRHDHKEIMSNVDGEQNIAFSMDLESGIKQKVLVPFIYNAFYDNINYSGIKFNGYRYRESDLNKKLLIKSRDELITEKFKEFVQDRQAIGFCCSVKHVERMVALFNSHGISAHGITYKSAGRDDIIDDFRRKAYQILFTRDIFNEGVDFPSIEALLFLRPTFSNVVFLQQLGRGLRLSPGKENVMILDFIGNYYNAYRIKDWVGFAELSDEPIKGNRERPRPEYIHQVAMVYFEKKVIDIFNEQTRNISIIPTIEQLEQNWLELGQKLGRIPALKELNDKSLSKVSMHWYYKYFENYNNFLIHMNAPPIRNKYCTLEQLEQNWLELKEKLGRVPTTKDLYKKGLSKFSTYAYEKNYGSYDNFLIHMNETPPEKSHPPYTKEELIAVYNKSKTDINIRNSFTKGGLRKVVQRLFGDYANLVLEADGTTEYTTVCKQCNKKNVINDLRKQRFILKEKIKYCKECQADIDSRKDDNFTAEKLIENYNEVQRILGRRPKCNDLRRPNSRYCIGPYKSQFGSWNKFLISIGETPNKMPGNKLDEELLRKNWQDLKTKLGRVPTTKDLDDKSLSKFLAKRYKSHYKNYKNAANTMGDEPNYIVKQK